MSVTENDLACTVCGCRTFEASVVLAAAPEQKVALSQVLGDLRCSACQSLTSLRDLRLEHDLHRPAGYITVLDAPPSRWSRARPWVLRAVVGLVLLALAVAVVWGLAAAGTAWVNDGA